MLATTKVESMSPALGALLVLGLAILGGILGFASMSGQAGGLEDYYERALIWVGAGFALGIVLVLVAHLGGRSRR